MNEVEKWQRRIKLKKISLIAIFLSVVLITLIVLLTLYGSNVGNFIIRIDEKQKNALSLFDTDEMNDPQELLLAKGIDELSDSTYTSIQAQIASASLSAGQHNDSRKRFFAYTFYIQNTSSFAVDYQVSLDIVAITKRFDSAMRVLIIKDDEQTIYAQRNKDGNPETCGENHDIQTVPFLSSTQVFSTVETNFDAEKKTRYTVAVWIEGWDEDCNDSIKGGTIKMEMNIVAV